MLSRKGIKGQDGQGKPFENSLPNGREMATWASSKTKSVTVNSGILTLLTLKRWRSRI